MMARLMLGAVAVMLATNLVVAGRGYYVSTNGSDTGAGTIGQPWRTVGKANSTLVAGDTVYIREGAYSDVIMPKNSGASGAPIVYTRYQAETVTLLGASPGMKGVVGIGWDLVSNSQDDPKSFVIVDGLVIRYQYASQYTGSANRFGYVQIGNPQSTYNTIRNCTIVQHGNALDNYLSGHLQAGILVTDAKHTLIEGNDISGTWLGVWLSGLPPSFSVVRRNFIHDIGASTIDLSDPETGVSGYQGNLIEYNVLSGSGIEDGIQFESNYNGDPVTSTSNRGTIVRYNVIRGCAENAIDLKGTSNIVVEGNLIYGNTGDDNGPIDGNDTWGGVGGLMHGANTSSKDIIIRNNIIYDNLSGLLLEAGYKVYNNSILANNRDYSGPNSTLSGQRFTGLVAFKGSRIAIKNNIFAYHTAGQMSLNLEGLANPAINNNLYWSSGEVRVTDVAGTLYQALGFDVWKQRLASRGFTGADERSKTADPQFEGVIPTLNGDCLPSIFRLSPGSPAVDAGGELTTAVGAGNGTSITVEDAGYFCDGFGIVPGDSIVVGVNAPVRITSVDYANQVLRVDRTIAWLSGDPVRRPFSGASPDMGALESGVAGVLLPQSAGPMVYVPTNGSTGVALSAMIRWSEIVGTTGYQIQIAMIPSFTSAVVDVVFDGLPSYPVASLGFLTKYYWRVRGLVHDSCTAWSAIQSFETGASGGAPEKGGDNVLTNGDFEGGTAGWRHYTDGAGTFNIAGPGFDGSQAAQVSVMQRGSNTELFQQGISLEPGFDYRLTFSAYSTAGHGMSIKLMKQASPWTNYATKTCRVALGTGWSTYTIALRTANFTQPVNDALIQFWFADSAADGEVYWIDGVSLVRTSASVPPEVDIQPTDFALEQNYPNPFNPVTKIRYSLPASSRVTLRVYDIVGAEVAGRDEGVQAAGVHEVAFDGSTLASGVYFYSLQAWDRVETKRMILMR